MFTIAKLLKNPIFAAKKRAARAQLLRALEVFLDRGGNAAETARVLNIHRNTLSYRLKQIENYSQISLNQHLRSLDFSPRISRISRIFLYFSCQFVKFVADFCAIG